MTTFILLALLSVVFAFLLSAAEAALFRTSRIRAAELLDDERRGSASLTRIVADSAAYLSVTAFLRVVAESAAAVLLTVAVTRWIDGSWKALVVAVGIMTLISFVLVGVSPQTLGRQHADTVALLSAPIIVGLRRVLGPVARLLIMIGNAVTPGRGYRHGPFQSESEVRDLLDLAGESSLIEADEREMIESVFELGDTVAREVMVPRTDMVTIDADRTCRQAMSLFLRSGFSRIPVVGEDTDDVLGLLYLKDVIRRTNATPAAAASPVVHFMRPMHFVPDSKPVDDLMREMQRDQSHLAVVVDEYGGTAGLVTIEDIIEEIVGEISDEYDREAPGVELLVDGRTRVPAAMDIDDLADLFEVDIEEDEVATVGGLLGKTIGQVPIVGSTCSVSGLRLTADRMAGRRHRIASVIIERLEPADSSTAEPKAGLDQDDDGTAGVA